MRIKLLLLAATTPLVACQTIQDQSIPLSPQFSQSAKVMEVKRPTWRLSDKVYHQQAGEFNIDGAAVSFAHAQSSQTWFKQSGGLLNGIEFKDAFLRFMFQELFLLNTLKTTKEFQLRGEQDFAFDVKHLQGTSVQSRCRLHYLNLQRDTEVRVSTGNKTTSSTGSSSERKESYLGCELKQNGATWYLSVETIENQSPSLRLISRDNGRSSDFQIKQVHEVLYLVNQQWKSFPSLTNTISGVTMHQQERQLAAMSFDGSNPKIWLSSMASQDQRALLVAVSYSLMMSDWLDSGWR